MPKVNVPTQIVLEYHQADTAAESSPSEMWMADPKYTNELHIDIYADDDSAGVPAALQALGRLQIEFAGSPRALEAFGSYLIGLARLKTADRDPHDHFEDVGSALGGTAHLIVRRKGA